MAFLRCRGGVKCLLLGQGLGLLSLPVSDTVLTQEGAEQHQPGTGLMWAHHGSGRPGYERKADLSWDKWGMGTEWPACWGLALTRCSALPEPPGLSCCLSPCFSLVCLPQPHTASSHDCIWLHPQRLAKLHCSPSPEGGGTGHRRKTDRDRNQFRNRRTDASARRGPWRQSWRARASQENPCGEAFEGQAGAGSSRAYPLLL